MRLEALTAVCGWLSTLDMSFGGDNGERGPVMSSAIGGGLGSRGELEGDFAAGATTGAAMMDELLLWRTWEKN